MVSVRELGSETELTDDEVATRYRHPVVDGRSWVRAGLVASVDGAVAVDGRSAGLSSEGDAVVFRVLRGAADVVLVGAGTVRDEGYGGVRLAADVRVARTAAGSAEVPPVAVVTGSGDLDPTSRLLTDTEVAPIVLSCEGADHRRLAGLRDGGADVVVLPGDHVDPRAALTELHRRGLRRVLCEGGPSLLGALVAADLVDELCLTTAPLLTGGTAGRVVHGPVADPPVGLVAAHVLADADGALLTRWVRR